jgi:O-antigen/teichoic acid export membrane protein
VACPLSLWWITWSRRVQSAAWPALEQFSSPASQLILAPVLLSRLSAAEFGLWAVALSVLLVSPALTLGRGLALLSVLPGAQAQGLPARQLVGLALRPMAACTLVAAVIAAGLIAWLRPLVFQDQISDGLLYVVLVVAWVVLTEIDNVASMALKALGRFQAAAAVECGGRALHVLACLLIVEPGWTATRTLLLTLAVYAAKTLCKVHWLRREPQFAAQDPDRTAKGAASASGMIAPAMQREFYRVGLWSVMHVVSGLMFYAWDRWLVGATAGVASVGAYAICSQYAQFSHSIIAAATQPLIPWAARSPPSSHARMRRLALWTAAVACVGPLLAWQFAGPALSLWIGPEFSQEHLPLAHSLCLCFLILALNVPFVNVLIGLGHTHLVARLALACGLGLIAWSLVWTPADMVGIATLKIAYAVGGLACVVWFWHLTRAAPDSSSQ